MSFDNIQTVSYTGTSFIWVKPINITSVIFELYGGGGGGGANAIGGSGAYTFASYNFLRGDISYNVIINVGGGGQSAPNSSGGKSGGGDASGNSNGGNGSGIAGSSGSGGGGGMTNILYRDATGTNIIKIVAGGGGGGGSSSGTNGGASGNIGQPPPNTINVYSSIGSNAIGVGGGGGGNSTLTGNAGLGGTDGGANGYYYFDSSGVYLFMGGGGGNCGLTSIGYGGGGGAGFGGGGGGSRGGGGGGSICQGSSTNYFLLGGGGAGGSATQNGLDGYVRIFWNDYIPVVQHVVVKEFMIDSQHTCRSIYTSPILKPAGVTYNNTNFIQVPIINQKISNLNSAVIGAYSDLYIIDGNGVLYAFDSTFTFKWSYTIANYTFFGTPAISDDGTLYISSAATVPSSATPPALWTIIDDITKPLQKWQFTYNVSDGNPTTSPILDVAGNIYFGTTSGALYSIKDSTNEAILRWSYNPNTIIPPPLGINTTGPIIGAPAFDISYTKLCYTTNIDGQYSNIIVLDLSGNINGNTAPIYRWSSSKNGGEFYNTPSIGTDNTSGIIPVFVSSNVDATSGNIYAYDMSSNTNTALWTIPINEPNISNVAIGANNLLYFTSQTAFNIANSLNGTLTWSYPINSIISTVPYNSTPIIDANNNVIFGSRNETLYSFNGSQRMLNWSYPVNGAIESMPVIGKYGNIYVATNNSTLYDFCGNSIAPPSPSSLPICSMFMLNAQHTGLSPYYGPSSATSPSVKWSADFVSGNLYVSPSIAIGYDGTLYIGTNDGNVNAYSSSGQLIWQIQVSVTSSSIYTTPVIAPDGTIYVGSYDGNLYALNPNGTKKWTYSVGSPMQSSPMMDLSGTLYFGAANKVYAIGDDGLNPYAKWLAPFETTSPVTINSSPALGYNGYIYFGSDDGNVYAVNRLTGLQMWTFDASGNNNPPDNYGLHPIYTSASVDASNNVIIGTGSIMNGVLYSLNGTTGAVNWAKSSNDWYNSIILLQPNIGPFYNTVAIYKDTIYLSTIAYVYSLKRSTGEMNWAYYNTNCYYTSPIVDASGTIFFGSIQAENNYGNIPNDGILHSIKDNGDDTYVDNWHMNTSVRVCRPGRLAPPVLGKDGTIYISATSNQVYAIK